jgi:PadR family transcriptional regulator
MTVSNLFDNVRMELRRGSLVLAVLAQLRSEQYGYTLRKALAEHGMEIDEGTLYPLLRRLESQGLLVSEWREEDKRNKRFYVLSANGKQLLKQLLAEWKNIDASLNGIVKG